MHAGEPTASMVHRNLCLGSEQQGSPSVFRAVVGERGVRGGSQDRQKLSGKQRA